MTTLKLALDWTPNVNHIGFFIAKKLGFYQEEGIELEILNPADDNYALTPGKKLELDLADFAIAPFETVISLNNKPNKVETIAIYAILQKDLSCIATLKTSDITTPKLLDGKIYASYKARYEDHIVKKMIENDGGTGNIKISYPDKLGIWNTLLNHQADATWIFDNWEGVEAKNKNIALNKFTLEKYKIPYGYSPVLLTKTAHTRYKKELYKKFLHATKKGYLFAKDNLKDATAILESNVTKYDLENINLEETIMFSQAHFGDHNTCGKMNPEKVSLFVTWLVENNLENSEILNQIFFTNEFLD